MISQWLVFQAEHVCLKVKSTVCLQEDDQRLRSLPLKTVEHVLALLPASVGNTPRDATPSSGADMSALTGADVRMAAANTVANLSQSLHNRCSSPPSPNTNTAYNSLDTPIMCRKLQSEQSLCTQLILKRENVPATIWEGSREMHTVCVMVAAGTAFVGWEGP
jgi:hypothetical protein